MPGKHCVRLIKLAKWLVESAWAPLRLFKECCEEELLWVAEMIKIKAQDLKGKDVSRDHLVRVNTSLLNRQTKSNRVQEKSEGYAKLEILSTLMLLFPLVGEAFTYLGSASSMHCMVRFLKSGDLSRRRNTVLVLRELISSDHRRVNVFLEIEGAIESLYKLIKEPFCPSAAEASLVIVYHMITSASAADKPIQKFVDMGLVSLLLEMLVDAQRSLCKKALGVLDGL